MTRRAPSRWLATLAAVLLTGWISLCAPAVARAASDDVFDRFEVAATLTPDGYVEVTETIELRFGSSSGRHGLERTLITREPDGNDHDVVYPIDHIRVSSPSPGVSTALDISDQGEGRNTYTRIRVGSADRTISAPTATYVLSYRVQGLMRSFAGYDELYWDLTGSSMPAITAAKASITVPGGVQGVSCSVATPGNQGPCATSTVDANGVAQFAASIPAGELLTVGMKITPGLVTNNTPIRVENAEMASARDGAIALAGSTALAGVVPILGWLYLRRRTRDFRYAGMPPGTFPPADRPAEEVPSDPRMEIPVSFAPPDIPVADAGLLVDGETQVRDTTATLVGLAVSGAIQLRSDGQQQVRLIDAERAPDALSRGLLVSLFPEGTPPGTEVDLGSPGTLTAAHEMVATVVLDRARSAGVFVREPGATSRISFGIGGLFFPVVMVAVFGFSFLGPVMLFVLPLLIVGVITWGVVRSKLRRGQRSAYGRAITDQVEGFRTYLATAEAEQLRFEEGEDIFSRYLPWAIMFDLTERWTRVCQRLVELGRLPATAPTWYYGNYWSMNSFGSQINDFSSSVAGSVAAPPSTSDTGFGSGGSSFSSSGGGGFSGGGGGGGGGGSW